MTKEEKMALESSKQHAAWAEFEATYPERFAALMYEFMTLGKELMYEKEMYFNVDKTGPELYLFQGQVTYPREATLCVNLRNMGFSYNYIYEFEMIEGLVKEYRDHKAEEARKVAAKREALEKVRNTLNAEELKLLGL